MTQSPIEPPNNPGSSSNRRNDEQTTGPLRPLTFDELVALFVAFLSLGGVLFWGLTRGDMNLTGEGSPLAVTPALTESDEDDVAGSLVDPEISPDGNAAAIAAAQDDDTPVAAASNSAQAELARRAAARRERFATRRPIGEDIRDGLVGTAAGVTGAAVTADGALADPETDAELNAAAIDADDTPESDVPDIGAAIPSEAAQSEPQDALLFQDVPDDYWARPYIDALSSRGLISGYEDGTFKPDQPITRSQIANIVSKTFSLTSDKENLEFSDVDADYWARESIGEVVKGGFMTGFPDDTFKPNIPVTRAQALTTLVTGLNIEPPTNIQASIDRYTDANEIPNWATDKIAAATSSSLVVNYPNIAELNPTEPTSRAELSAIIYQALVREGIVEPVETEYVVKP